MIPKKIIFLSGTVFFILAASLIFIITVSSCTNTRGPKNPPNQKPEAVENPQSETPKEIKPETNPPEETQESGQDESGNEEIGHAEKFVPTQEKPLAPPAQPAKGAENMPPGELGVAASIEGARGKIPMRDGAVVQVSNEIWVQCTIANKTQDTVEIVFANSQKLDIIFLDSGGNEVYRWSKNRRFAQVLDTLTLEPGKTWNHELTIPIGSESEFLKPGTYEMVVVVTGNPRLEARAKDVRITKG